MTLALLFDCRFTNPSRRTDEVGQVLTIRPRPGAARPRQSLCSDIAALFKQF
jgi:hypothetical protein